MTPEKKFTAETIRALLGEPRLMPGESEENYQKLWEAFVEDYQPETLSEWLDVDHFAHGSIAGVIWMQVIPRQLSERAVWQIVCLHVAGRRVDRNSVKILDPVIDPGAANEGIEYHAAGIMPRTVTFTSRSALKLSGE